MDTAAIAKKAAAYKAVEWVEDGMTIGIGTGSTAYFAIEALSQRVKAGLAIKAVASSVRSESLAAEMGITIVPLSSIDTIDIGIDGADEVDKAHNLTKGGGGALVREKILAANSKKFIVVVDESKLVEKLGQFPVAVEVVPFAYNLTLNGLRKLGCRPTMRVADNQLFTGDNGNFIADCQFEKIEDPALLNERINSLAGVIESGLFPSEMVHTLIAGYKDGSVQVLKK